MLHPHPKNARIKCLELEQVQLLARLHSRVLQQEEKTSERPDQVQSQESLIVSPDADLCVRLAQMEAQVATLQTQVTDLTLQLLQEREQHMEQRLFALEAEHNSSGGADDLAKPVEGPRTVEGQVVLPLFARHATEKRLIPLIEYGARGSYVLIDPQAGELLITPDLPEWFEWVASLSSFRFVGRSGGLSAR